MKRHLTKKVNSKLRQFSEDMQVLQHKIRHESVYKRHVKGYFERRPKYVKRAYVEIYR